MSRRRIATLTAAVTLALTGAFATGAQGSFHLMKVREFFPGTTADPDSAFIELQMFSSGQNFVLGRSVVTYTSTGTLLSSFTIPGNALSGADQRTILVGDTNVAGRDFTYMALGDAVEPNRAAGAVCFPDALPPDCASFGMFTGAGLIPGTTGTPVLFSTGIPNGSSITRSISRGCATLLEAADDTNNSIADFAQTAPTPRSNSVAPTEKPCPTKKKKCKKKKGKSGAVAAKKCKKKKKK